MSACPHQNGVRRYWPRVTCSVLTIFVRAIRSCERAPSFHPVHHVYPQQNFLVAVLLQEPACEFVPIHTSFWVMYQNCQASPITEYGATSTSSESATTKALTAVKDLVCNIFQPSGEPLDHSDIILDEARC